MPSLLRKLASLKNSADENFKNHTLKSANHRIVEQFGRFLNTTIKIFAVPSLRSKLVSLKNYADENFKNHTRAFVRVR